MPTRQEQLEESYKLLGLRHGQALSLAQLDVALKNAQQDAQKKETTKKQNWIQAKRYGGIQVATKERKKDAMLDAAYLDVLKDEALHAAPTLKPDFNKRLKQIQEEEEARLEREYNASLRKPQKRQEEVALSSTPQPNVYALLKADVKKIEKMFNAWLTDNGLGVAQGFAAVIVGNIIKLYSPADGEHKGKMSEFMQDLAKNGFISENQLAKSPYAPKPPMPSGKKQEEEDSGFKSPFRMRNPGETPRPEPGR